LVTRSSEISRRVTKMAPPGYANAFTYGSSMTANVKLNWLRCARGSWATSARPSFATPASSDAYV
jgi:hypothetical protein